MKRIFILGSLNMDLVIQSPYMPVAGETLTGSDFMTNPGGKGANQAAACAKLGGDIFMAGCVGDDDFGKIMKNNLDSFGVNTRYVKTLKNQSSGIAVIIVIDGDNRIILNKGANEKVEKEDIDEFLKEAKEGDIFLTQLETPVDMIGYALKSAKEKKLFTILNPAPADKSVQKYIKYVDLITPNESELKLLSDTDGIEEGVKALINKGIKNIVVTLGSKGYAYTNGEKLIFENCKKVKAVDTTAAGDTFCGGLAVQLSKDIKLDEALKFASLAASVSVTRKGAQMSIPTFEEVIKNK